MDCPLIDVNMLDDCLDVYFKKKLDLLNNGIPPTFPDGLDISIFNYNSLFHAWKNAKTKYDKEHVVPFMIRNKNLKKFNYTSKKNYSSERWTLDNENDYIVLKNIFNRFKKINFSWKDVLKIRKKYPEDFISNQYNIRNEGISSSTGQKLWKKAIHLILVEQCFYLKIQTYTCQIFGQVIIRELKGVKFGTWITKNF